MRYLLVMFVFIAFAYGCTSDTADLVLPEGYTLVCSDSGKYSLKSDSFGDGISANVWSSERAAKEYAWLWEKCKDKTFVLESSKYDWHACE